MNHLSLEERTRIVACLVEGNSIRGTCRLTGAAKGTVSSLFATVAQACYEYQRNTLRNLPCMTLQVDEMWSFCYAKEKNVPDEYKGQDGYGNAWIWVAICADTKLVPCWLVGDRELHSAYEFLTDLKSRLANRVQITSDGYRAYPAIIEGVFAGDSYSMLVKRYDTDSEGNAKKRTRYKGADRMVMFGNPNPKLISTSYIERQNLTMRMHNRRLSRKTNAFSKKIENHKLSVALHFMYYNFVRIHQSLRITPAMAARVTDHVWEVEDMVRLAYP